MMNSAALDKVLDEIGYVSKETLEEERKMREEERKMREEERKKAIVSLHSIGLTPESISSVFGISINEVLRNLVDYLSAHPKDPVQRA
jgi:hypothetical protein